MNVEELDIIQNAIKTLENGGVILYPTDTIWGIGCDATNIEAVKKVYSLKKRTKNKPLILLVDRIKILEKYVKSVPKIAYKIIQNAEEPTTIIYEDPIKLPELLISNNTIGIRVVKNSKISKLLKKFNKPLTSTSANISNSENPKSFLEIDDYIKNNVDYIVPIFFNKDNTDEKPSRIIKIKGETDIHVIRN